MLLPFYEKDFGGKRLQPVKNEACHGGKRPMLRRSVNLRRETFTACDRCDMSWRETGNATSNKLVK